MLNKFYVLCCRGDFPVWNLQDTGDPVFEHRVAEPAGFCWQHTKLAAQSWAQQLPSAGQGVPTVTKHSRKTRVPLSQPTSVTPERVLALHGLGCGSRGGYWSWSLGYIPGKTFTEGQPRDARKRTAGFIRRCLLKNRIECELFPSQLKREWGLLSKKSLRCVL